MAYGLRLGVTTHLDQGAFQATGTPADGAAHEDNVTMHLPFLRLLSLTGWRYLAGSPTSNGPPFRMIVDSGIHAGMSSDGIQIAPMNPWLHMYYATTGRNARGELINDGQQISRREVLRLYTADNGWFLRMEDRLGTIERGSYADLVVLDRDYFTVADEDLKQVRSVLTLVGGEVGYADPQM